ncbi:MAG: transcription elongation factor GreA [Thermodesulfobacteriota bacterium]|nr:MAG: transcription elongation factor GreA [Thermodesulfobacteriota bacterium]
MTRRPITKEGYNILMKELKFLKEKERPKIIKEIGEARGHGDISENAEYEAAKDKQGILEARIKDLEYRLSMAEIIDPSTLSHDRIAFGATVRLLNVETDEEQTYQLVGPDESDVAQKKISVYSPLGHALLGKQVDDSVMVNAPKGVIEYEVLEISFD